ncbi:hypothetical protein PINS_up014279 [Pythium insidiosum]|nr:hypothetical protein PINS_up014279 [Pythium insidiosum]
MLVRLSSRTSAWSSCRSRAPPKVGRHVNQVVASRFGKTILELGGNNAMIVDQDADLEMALRATLFSAVGTAGQRCTSLRRLFLHEDIHDEFLRRLLAAYKTVKVGNPLEDGVLCGPLHNTQAVKNYVDGIKTIKEQGGKILIGGKTIDGPGHFVEPTIVSITHDAPIVQKEIFAPIMYVLKFKTLEEAIEKNNAVPQGLSSSILHQEPVGRVQVDRVRSARTAVSSTSTLVPAALRIGGAFGGEKETGRWPRVGAQTAGSSTCADRRARSTTARSCRWRSGINFS